MCVLSLIPTSCVILCQFFRHSLWYSMSSTHFLHCVCSFLHYSFRPKKLQYRHWLTLRQDSSNIVNTSSGHGQVFFSWLFPNHFNGDWFIVACIYSVPGDHLPVKDAISVIRSLLDATLSCTIFQMYRSPKDNNQWSDDGFYQRLESGSALWWEQSAVPCQLHSTLYFQML